jgi:hypothetical protein
MEGGRGERTRLRALGACALLACLLALAPAAPAGAHPPNPVDEHGRPLGGSIHRWMHQARVPLVEGRVQFVLHGCPNRPWFAGCVFSRRPRRIYLRPGLRNARAVVYHELGHIFDFIVLNRRERRAFMRIMHLHHHRWYTGRQPAAEWFADGYSLCAMGRSIRTARRTAYGYQPAPRQHAAVCRLIVRAAAPRGRRPQQPVAPPAVIEPPAPPPEPPPSPDPPSPPEDCSWLEGMLAGCD